MSAGSTPPPCSLYNIISWFELSEEIQLIPLHYFILARYDITNIKFLQCTRYSKMNHLLHKVVTAVSEIAVLLNLTHEYPCHLSIFQ